MAYPCPAQGDAGATDGAAVGVASAECYPAIRGQCSNDVISARLVTWSEGKSERKVFVVFHKAAGQAIIAHSTNDVCLFKGRLFTVVPAGPSQAAFINISKTFGSSEFTADAALQFRARIANAYYLPASPDRKLVDLAPILKREYETSHSAIGTPLHHVELTVEMGQLTLLFESYSRIKGKVILDDSLNPVMLRRTTN